MTYDNRVTPEVRLAVLRRDRYRCVATVVDPTIDQCRGRHGDPAYDLKRGIWREHMLTVDHVWPDYSVKGRKAPSVPGNLVTLCWHHHLNGWATAHREALRAYLTSRMRPVWGTSV